MLLMIQCQESIFSFKGGTLIAASLTSADMSNPSGALKIK